MSSIKWTVVNPPKRPIPWHVAYVHPEDPGDPDIIKIDEFHSECPISIDYQPATVSATTGDVLHPAMIVQRHVCNLAWELENNGWSGFFPDMDRPEPGWYRLRAELVKVGGEFDVDYQVVRMEGS